MIIPKIYASHNKKIVLDLSKPWKSCLGEFFTIARFCKEYGKHPDVSLFNASHVLQEIRQIDDNLIVFDIRFLNTPMAKLAIPLAKDNRLKYIPVFISIDDENVKFVSVHAVEDLPSELVYELKESVDV